MKDIKGEMMDNIIWIIEIGSSINNNRDLINDQFVS
jgi:hypothetical protein